MGPGVGHSQERKQGNSWTPEGDEGYGEDGCTFQRVGEGRTCLAFPLTPAGAKVYLGGFSFKVSLGCSSATAWGTQGIQKKRRALKKHQRD